MVLSHSQTIAQLCVRRRRGASVVSKQTNVVLSYSLKAAYFIYTPSEYHYDFEPLYMYNA